MVDQMNTNTKSPSWWNDKHASTWDHVKGALKRDWEQTKADFSTNAGTDLNQNAVDTLEQSVMTGPIIPLDVKTRPTEPKDAAKAADKAHDKMDKASRKADETELRAYDDIAQGQVKLDEKIGEIRQDEATREAKVREQRAVADAHAGAEISAAQKHSEAHYRGTEQFAQARSDASDKIAESRAKANDKIAESRAKANDKIASAREKESEDVAQQHAKIAKADNARAEAISRWQVAEQEVRYGFSVRSQFPTNQAWDAKLEGRLHDEWDELGTGRTWSDSQTAIHRGWDYANKER